MNVDKLCLQRGKQLQSPICGKQEKFYDSQRRVFCKYDSPGCQEALAEVTADCLLCSLSFDDVELSHVHYWLERKQGRVISCSCNFTDDGIDEISLATLLGCDEEYMQAITEGIPNSEFLNLIIRRTAELTKYFFFEDWLARLVLVDLLLLNEDRNLNNISFLRTESGLYSVTPVFDNGAAYRHFNISDVYMTFRAFEPNPCGQEQLELVNGLRDTCDVKIDLDRFDMLFDSADCDKFYPMSVVQRFKKMVYNAVAEIKALYPFIGVK